jgi:hypothetical protein
MGCHGLSYLVSLRGRYRNTVRRPRSVVCRPQVCWQTGPPCVRPGGWGERPPQVCGAGPEPTPSASPVWGAEPCEIS